MNNTITAIQRFILCRMKLKRYEAIAEGYHNGRFHRSFTHMGAARWLEQNWSYDVLTLIDRWTGKRYVLKDQLKEAFSMIPNMRGSKCGKITNSKDEG